MNKKSKSKPKVNKHQLDFDNILLENEISSEEKDMEKFTKRVIYYINSNIPINIYGLSGTGKSFFINNLFLQYSEGKYEERINSKIVISDFNDILYNDEIFFQDLVNMFFSYNNSSLISDIDILSKTVKLDFHMNITDLYKKFQFFNGIQSIIVIIDNINSVKLLEKNIEKFNSIFELLISTGQGIVFVSPFLLSNTISSRLIDKHIHPIKFPYHLPRKIIENSVLSLLRFVYKGNNEDDENSKITQYRERAIMNLKFYIYNYNDYIFFFKHYTEFFICLKYKDFNHHFKMYLNGSCFHYSNLNEKTTKDQNVRFEIFKDLIDRNENYIIGNLSFHQKVFLTMTYIGCILNENDSLFISLFKKGSKNMKVKMKQKGESIKKNKSEEISLQKAFYLYSFMMDKLLLEGLFKKDFKRIGHFSEFELFDKNVDLISNVNHLEKMNLIKIRKQKANLEHHSYVSYSLSCNWKISVLSHVSFIDKISYLVGIKLSEYIS